MQRPRTPEEYVELVRQTLFETEELRQAAEYDTDEMAAALGFLDALEAELRQLYAAMEDGSYDFADADLPFMAIVEKQNERVLPFKRMLRLINLTHRQGLESGEE
jgi:alkylhydroperoxidase family enzyme